MKTNSVAAMDKLGLQQLLVKVEAEIVDVQSQISQAEKALISHRSELETLTERSTSRNQALQMANQTISQLQTELEKVRTRALLAQGTLIHTDEASTRDLETRVERAQKELTQLQIRAEKEESADADRRATVQPQLAKCQSFISELKPHMQALLETKKEVHQELGQALYSEYLQRLQQAHDVVTALDLQVSVARSNLDTCSAETLQALQSWQSLQSQIKPLCTYRDNSTEILEAYLHLVTLLDEKGYGANLAVEEILYKIDNMPYRQLAEMLALSIDDISTGFYGMAPAPTSLQEKLKFAQQAASTYREEKLKG